MSGPSFARTTVWETVLSLISTVALATTQGAIAGMSRHSWPWGIAVGVTVAALLWTIYALRRRGSGAIPAVATLVGSATLALLLYSDRLIGWRSAIAIAVVGTILGTVLVLVLLRLTRGVRRDNEVTRARQEAADARRQHGA
jgi:hypothetical protein